MKRFYSVTMLGQHRRYLFLALLVVLVAALPVSASPADYRNSDDYLYNQAVQAEQRGDWLQVAMFLKAYVEREPVRMNTDANHRGLVYQHLNYAQTRINNDIGLAVEVQKNQQALQQCTELSGTRGTFNNPNPPPPPPLLSAVGSCSGRPGPNEVMLFMHFDYQPPCVVKTVGRYDNADQIGLPNDSISSLRVGSNVRAILCMHGGQTGLCETFTYDDPNLSNNAIGNDQVTSARVEWR